MKYVALEWAMKSLRGHAKAIGNGQRMDRGMTRQGTRRSDRGRSSALLFGSARTLDGRQTNRRCL